ncbi:MAG: efflux RND transporter permease subunit [Desulfovibrio sp.]|jgi:multidrug efflux pump|nr:efflux RND transporter permease subunit [Desulfovibrio sp.]
MARFFIDRPIFAWVIAIIVMMAGASAMYTLPIAQYPPIAPPEISIVAFYPGASAKTIEDSVTQVIEQKMNGLDHLNYLYSTSDSTGQVSINLSFAAGTNADIAQVQVQNKLQLAMPLLPEMVQRQGIRVVKSTRNFLLVIGFVSENGSMNAVDISDYIAANIQEPVSRMPGVGDITVFGAQYAMRIWCDPAKFEQYRLMPSDVAQAVQAQNNQVAGGQIGGLPAMPGQQISVTVNAASRFETVEQFAEIILRVNPDGSSLRLKDVARIELDSENPSVTSRYNGNPASGLAIKLASGANALETADVVKKRIEEMSEFFPSGLKVVYPYDTTPFVRISIHEVYKTLAEAIVLVFLVMYLFLQDFRATLIPTIAVPVVLLGTFGVLSAVGFSINTLTMFAMVLAIGLLVDDAIVVVENVERIMREERLPPKEATRKSMGQLTGALVGIALVLSAVFVPMAFFGGSVGAIYRQFSVTIVSSMVLSVLVAMILTPALCATILKPHTENTRAQQGLFGRFNRWFDELSFTYQKTVHRMVLKPMRYLLVYLLAAGLMAFLFLRLPTSFLPDEDQGILFAMAQLPPAASKERTAEVMKKVEQHFLEDEKDAVAGMMAVTGFSFSGNGQNAGMAFIRLKDWKDRDDKKLRVPAIQARAMAKFSRVAEAMIFVFAPPAVMELGSATGFDFELIDQTGQGHEKLMEARNQLLGMASQHPDLRNVRPNGLNDVEQHTLDIDLSKAGALSLNISEIYGAISAFWGSAYINDFLDRGRTKKVYLQADAPFRMQAEDFKRYYARNAKGEMVPFSAFLSGHATYGSPRLERYNGLPSMEILGEATPGKSSGHAMRVMEELVKKLPAGFGFSWTGLSLQERMSGSQAPMLYAISLMVVFLCLAALYESWSIPFSVMLVVPFGIIGALAGAYLRGMNNDVYFQVGLLTIVGLSAKNAILIVEFAKELEESGQEAVAAVVQAVRLRLRPIIMTSMAFILGVLPLVISTGAGSGSQNAIGTGVMAGMIAATWLGIYYTPVFFIVIRTIFKVRVKSRDIAASRTQHSAHGEKHAP